MLLLFLFCHIVLHVGLVKQILLHLDILLLNLLLRHLDRRVLLFFLQSSLGKIMKWLSIWISGRNLTWRMKRACSTFFLFFLFFLKIKLEIFSHTRVQEANFCGEIGESTPLPRRGQSTLRQGGFKGVARRLNWAGHLFQRSEKEFVGKAQLQKLAGLNFGKKNYSGRHFLSCINLNYFF